MIQLSSFCIDLFDLTFSQLPTDSLDLAGWVLKDISEGYPSFVFPSYILQPRKGIRVYTNEIYPEYGGFTFGCGKAIWNNTDLDTAALYNAQGQEVSRKSYQDRLKSLSKLFLTFPTILIFQNYYRCLTR